MQVPITTMAPGTRQAAVLQAVPIIAGSLEPINGAKWFANGPRLCLKIPAGQDPLKFTVWMTTAKPDQSASRHHSPIAGG